MPDFSGREAMKIFRERNIEAPFIFVSGTIGEDTAIATLKSGANRLGRLLQFLTLLVIMWTPLIGTATAHAAAARHHPSTTTDHADHEQRDAHNRKNILQIHIRFQAAEIRERGKMPGVSSNLSFVPLSLQSFACLRS
jgi:hypothetical protein